MELLPWLGRQAEWWLVEVGLIRCGLVKALMRSAAIVEIEVSADRVSCLADAFVGPQIHVLVFDAAPQPFEGREGGCNDLRRLAAQPPTRKTRIGESASWRAQVTAFRRQRAPSLLSKTLRTPA